MAELLLELFSEEIPARMQRQAADDLKRLVLDGLKDAALAHGEARCYWTPRRLALVVEGLPTEQPDSREERKGPKVGAPDKAVEGFLKSCGLDSLDQCEQRETPKGPVWFAVIEKKGGQSADVLPGLIVEAIRQLPWPKSMRFAGQSFRWVRPLHSVLAVFAGRPLEGSLDLGGGDALSFGDRTRGHRFLAPAPFAVTGFDDYAARLRAADVILDPDERRDAIDADLRAAADREGLTVKEDPGLLDEVANLVERPAVLVGKIDDQFMDVPDEALTASMRGHQKYFSLLRPDGSLAPRFATVANMIADDGGEAIRGGNERVLRARLADAKFFWDQDRAVKLEDRLPSLEKVIFHAKLGTVAERVERIASLAEVIAGAVEGCPANEARRAARLSKADLVSEMVGEFPELQGIMGRYYALEQNEPEAVAQAIAEHYSPAGPHDACPTAPVSVVLALAEKVDTLVGFWLIDEKPTGSKDPFALRRAALGVIRLVLENGVRLPLLNLLRKHTLKVDLEIQQREDLERVEKQRAAGVSRPRSLPAIPRLSVEDIERMMEIPDDDVPVGYDDVVRDLLSFFADRMKAHYRQQGRRHDVVSAVFALAGEDDLLRLARRVDALTAFVESDDGANLLTAYRRAANILRAEEKKDDRSYAGAAIDAGALQLDAEKALADGLAEAEAAVETALTQERFDGAMTALAGLRAPVDAFFDDVTVNADDPALRANRLALLATIRGVMGKVADFSAIEG